MTLCFCFFPIGFLRAQTEVPGGYYFNDNTSQGWSWHLNDPISGWNEIGFFWDDNVNYPNDPYDPVGNNLGSISIQTPATITNSPAQIEFEFRSPDISGDTNWQNAKGWTAQLMFLGGLMPGDPFPGAYAEYTTGHERFLGDALSVFTGSGWHKITVVFPDDLQPFKWLSIRFNYPEGLQNVMGGVFLDNFEPLMEVPLPVVNNLTALNGYHNAVPVAWSLPENPDQSGTSDPSGYNLYRSNQVDGPFEIKAQNLQQLFYRDSSVNNGDSYYYMVRAVYESGESDDSNIALGQPEVDGYYYHSNWATQAPAIDGVIGQSEWADAAQTIITYPGRAQEVILYTMNDAERLYFAVDNPEDVVLDDWDNFSIFLDTNHDRLWPGENSEEGLLRCYWDETLGQAGSTFLGIGGEWQNNISVADAVEPQGTDEGISLTSGHVQYELSVDFNVVPMQASPPDLISIMFFGFDNGNSKFDALWPEKPEVFQSMVEGYLWSYGPFAYGDLRIAAVPSAVHSESMFVPQTTNMLPNFPNPFNPSTRIVIELNKEQHVLVAIYNTLGQQMVQLVDDRFSAGRHTIEWDGKDHSGINVPSGIYLYRFIGESDTFVKKMTLLR